MKKRLLRKVTILFVALFVTVVTSVYVFAEDMPISVYVNGNKIDFDVEPVMEDDRTLVPVRAVSEGLGCVVDWDETTYSVIISDKKGYTEEKDEYSFNELSPKDYEEFISLKNNIRYNFEQMLLPQTLFAFPSDVSQFISQQNPELKNTIIKIWDYFCSEMLVELQLASEDSYVFEVEKDPTDEELLEMYKTVLKKCEMSAEDMFAVEYKTTPNGKIILLLTFKDATSKELLLIQCKYIAMVAENNGIRYITAETDAFSSEQAGKEVYMLCEVMGDERGSYEIIDTTMDAFLTGVDKVLDEKTGLGDSLKR